MGSNAARLPRERIIELYKDGYEPRLIAAKTGCLPHSVRAFLSKHGYTQRRRAEAAPAITPREPLEFPVVVSISGTDEKRAAWQRYMETTLEWKPRLLAPLKDFRSVVAMGDFHGDPSMELVAQVISLEPDILVAGGDLLDSAQVNPHEPADGARTVRNEIQTLRAMFETMLSRLPDLQIKVMRGNHDDWVRKYLVKTKDVQWEILKQFFRDPLDMIVEGLPNTELVESNFRYHYANGHHEPFADTRYMYLLGDALFSHMNFTGKKPGDAADKLHAWVRDWQEVLNLPQLRLLVQFHGHKQAHIELGGGNHIRIEPGMAARPRVEAYKVNYQPKWRPGAVGAVYMEQYLIDGQWRTDLNSVMLIKPHQKLRRTG